MTEFLKSKYYKAVKEIHKSFNGSLEGCKRWFWYCKEGKFDDEERNLEEWNTLNEIKTHTDYGNFRKFIVVQKVNGELAEVNYFLDNNEYYDEEGFRGNGYFRQEDVLNFLRLNYMKYLEIFIFSMFTTACCKQVKVAPKNMKKLQELHKAHGASLEDCKQWLDYCKEHSDDPENLNIYAWNNLTIKNAELFDDWFYEIKLVRKSGDKLVIEDVLIDKATGEWFEQMG